MMQPAATHVPETAKPPAERYLDIARVSKQFGATVVLQELDLSVARSEFVSLLGPSGCGKTTLLRLIAGLQRPDRGQIRINGSDITHVAAHKRNVGVVFQNYALFPHLTVEQNVGFGLMAQRRPKSEVAAAVANALELVRMQEYAQRRISALSGGQQQRIAVARAIVVKPTLLLLDEPFSALDRKLRETMQIELRHLLRELNITSIFVTHDQDEALVMSDRIAVMNNGRIEQLGAPGDVYRRPTSLHVLEFVGQSTRLSGTVDRDGSAGDRLVTVDTPLGKIRAPRRSDTPGSGRAVLGVRPESIVLGERPGADTNQIKANLADIVFFGSKTALHFETQGSGDRLQVELSRVPDGLAPGVELTLRWPVAETMIYPLP
jgi:putative spermidine/putrescine transport system ATP-binding protein